MLAIYFICPFEYLTVSRSYVGVMSHELKTTTTSDSWRRMHLYKKTNHSDMNDLSKSLILDHSFQTMTTSGKLIYCFFFLGKYGRKLAHLMALGGITLLDVVMVHR